MSGHGGIRAQFAIDEPDGCPVADAAATLDGSVSDVRWTRTAGDRATERVRLPNRREDDSAGADTDAPPEGFRRVVAGADGTVAEFDRDGDGCVCERIEALGCPVADAEASDGTLYVTVRVRDSDRLRSIVAAAGAAAERVRLTYVVRGDLRDGDGDPVVVDRDRLTDRQREAVETAFELGYFAHPRAANASEVAAEIGVAPSTFREHLASAQGQLFDDVFREA
ncbi:helix-turn-helix domain-containing protein [Halobaculum litoreum]|uniref:Helix-turn-helix domain-containing protein n=1 Tax=Halobaculum litoreum TaxID=3031998 RepID=A0ABD5XXJ3_9EURY